jgi:hypothetical protein
MPSTPSPSITDGDLRDLQKKLDEIDKCRLKVPPQDDSRQRSDLADTLCVIAAKLQK